MTINLFGQSISLEEKHIMIGTGVIIGVIALLGAFFLVMPKYTRYTEVKTELETEQASLQSEQAKYTKEFAKLQNLKKVYEEQKMNLEALKNRFKEASLNDETDLKILVQKLIIDLGLKSIEIGAAEVAAEKQSYTKKYIPYKLTGSFEQLGRFFYYLENSKWLLTFKGSDLRLTKQEKTGKDGKTKIEYLEASFKVGAYILKGGEFEVE